jgi:hypothetical protein
MPSIEAAHDVLASSIELKSTMSNALCDTEHICGAKACRNDIAALTRDRDVRQSHRLREPQTLKLARREAKALFKPTLTISTTQKPAATQSRP